MVTQQVHPEGPLSTITDRGDTSRRVIAYTFDAGGGSGSARQILDHLKHNDLPSSFGLTGMWVNANPAHARRIATDGHHLINHTWDHRSFTGSSSGASALSRASRLWQIQAAEAKFQSVMGKGSRPYFRPPYGDIDDTVRRDVGAVGFTKIIMWTFDSLGWAGLTSEQICARLKRAIDNDSRGGNGMILLFHVGCQPDADALPWITTFLRSKGFAFGTVPHVLAP